MIDTHCHLLPQLDDGPANDRAALTLASGLAASGVAFVLCTPHYSSRFPTDHLEALRREAALVRLLESEGVDLEIAVAAEVSPERAVAADPDELRTRSIAGRFVIVELLPDTPVVSLATISFTLAKLDLLPIFAHPERCRALARGFAPLDDVRRDGALIQVVATSLTGRWGAEIHATAWRLVDTGRADLIGSDAHHGRHGTVLRRAAELVEDRLGENTKRELTELRPKLIISGTHPDTASRR